MTRGNSRRLNSGMWPYRRVKVTTCSLDLKRKVSRAVKEMLDRKKASSLIYSVVVHRRSKDHSSLKTKLCNPRRNRTKKTQKNKRSRLHHLRTNKNNQKLPSKLLPRKLPNKQQCQNQLFRLSSDRIKILKNNKRIINNTILE